MCRKNALHVRHHPGRDRNVTQSEIGYVFGAIYVVVGLLGFVVTGFEGFADLEGELLLGVFEVNPLHNLVHLAVGVALAGAAAAGAAASRSVNIAVGAVYLILGVAGFFVPTDSPINILALNIADHFLHLGSGAVLVGIGMYERGPATVRT